MQQVIIESIMDSQSILSVIKSRKRSQVEMILDKNRRKNEIRIHLNYMKYSHFRIERCYIRQCVDYLIKAIVLLEPWLEKLVLFT